ncbi:nuclear transport factor 2 family protein [Aliiglaciecola sp. CAU 1673]|uniref:YybH family protein n=1 Tax=Aliiglaciecola sp. CAU 1673 TaxID=3032595 RepID=UPI0023DC2303|nr:nuclear transport factor 2 family protein [Aliiglaciecola sp. CAU 1673]MDF2179882.1 nuclear transport factor 2 family protein [Aliiglaciecola sp. CAU 1673]
MLKTINVLALALLMASANAHEQNPAPQAGQFSGLESEAAKVVQAFHQALTTGNAEQAKTLLADDVVIYEGGGIERSAAEYAAHHMQADMKYLAAVHSQPLEHHVQVNQDSAYSLSVSHVTGQYKDKEVDYKGMETMVLVKTDAGWKIKHIHWSN